MQGDFDISEDDERSELLSVRDWVRWGASAFERAGLYYGHGSDNALDEAFYLVLWALKLPLDLPAAYLEARLVASERAAVAKVLDARIRTRKPAAYLTGEAWFAGLCFEVNEQVLIPRSPIAELIQAGFEPWLAAPPDTILDLCTGCGCIGIACAVAFPDAQVDLAELEAPACEVCRRNVERHDLVERCRVLQGDLFDAAGDRRYDLIICNPPYVPAAECDALPAEYQHEPRGALVSGADGMDCVARLLDEAPMHLHKGGTLVCEIGASQAEFDARFPQFPGLWPEFAHGGSGVFVISRADLVNWQASRVQ